MRKRSLLATALLVSGLWAGCVANAEDVNSYDSLKSALEAGTSATLTDNIALPASPERINASQDSTLNMSGYAIDGTGVSSTANIIQATANNLVINGGTFQNITRNTDWGSVAHLTSGGNLTINDTRFLNNTSSTAGSLSVGTAAGSITLNNVTFENNSAGEIGAVGLYKAGTFNGVTFKNNEATNENGDGTGALFLGSVSSAGIGNSIRNSVFEGNTSAGRAGAVGMRDFSLGNNSGAVLDIDNTYFISNTAVTNGGAIDNYFYNDAAGDGYVKITNSGFTSNTAANGGAIYNHIGSGSDIKVGGEYQVGKMYVANTSFTGNTATAQGGAIYNAGTINVKNSTFTSNNTLEGDTPTVAKHGGAIYNTGDLTITGESSFKDNSAFGSGGAIYNTGDLTITGTSDNKIKFINNTTTKTSTNGGAIFNNNGKLSIDNVSFEKNALTGNGNGGAVWNNSTQDSSISNSIFTGNYTKYGNLDNGGSGGAIWNSGTGKLTLENNTFSGNGMIVDEEGNVTVKTNMGGAIYNNAGTIDIKGGSIADNIAKTGGAIYAKGTVNIDGTTITDNTSTSGSGGAIYVTGGEAHINNATIDGNVGLKEYAAGFIVVGPDDSGNYHTVPVGTVNDGKGGAIYNSASGKTSSITGGIISNNISKDGGGIYNNAGTITIDGTKFESNVATATGGAILNNATLNIKDTDFTNNIASTLGGAIYNGKTSSIINIDGSNTFSGNKSNVTYDESGNILSSVDNDIYNNGGTINIVSGEGEVNTFESGIAGNNQAAKLNINGAGTVDMQGNLTNHTVNVNAGELHLTTTATNGSNLAGSTVTVASGAIVNTIDGVINDYSSAITLANGAKVKLDTSLSGTASADKYIIASGDSVTINEIKVLTDINDSDDSKTVYIAEAGNVSIASGVVAYTTNNKYTVSGNSSNNGTYTLTKHDDEGGLRPAANDTEDVPTHNSVTYTLTGVDTTTSAGTATITNADMTIQGAGNSDTKKVVLSNNLNVGASDTDNSTLTINEAKFEQGSTSAGMIVNNTGATLTIKDSIIGVTIQNKGTLISDPTTYTARQINEGTASYTDDTFALASPYTGAADTTVQGGALYNTGTLTLTNTDFTDNIAQSATSVEGATKNSAATGGAIWTNKAINVTGGTFSGNKAYGRSWNGTASGSIGSVGGAIAFSGGTGVTTDSTLDGVTFTNNKVTYDYVSSGSSTNSTTGYGGAIYYNQAAKLNILGNSTFTGNESGYGGAIYGAAGSVIIGGDGNNVNISNNTSKTQGGGIFNSNANLSVTDAIIASNTSGTGGGIYTKGGTITGTDINSNSATNTSSGNGGGVYNTIGNLTVTDSTIGGSGTGNTAKVSGGGIYNLSGALTVDNTSVTYNTAKFGSTSDSTSAGGGGIYKAGSGALTIQNSSHIDNNTATKSRGGGIYNTGSGAITIDESTVSNNTANYGGGIYKGSTGTLTITETDISSNTANNIGGGIYNAGSGNVSLTDTTMSGNTAGIAGAIASMSSSKLDITHSTFTANTATDTNNGRGGVIYAQNAGDITILGSAFGDGTAANANIAATNGGAINVSNTKLTIDKDASDNNTTFNYNTAQSGGAIFASSSAVLDIANTDFSNNKATGTVGDSGDGGAIYITYSATSADIDNVAFTSNSAVRSGGAVWAGVNTTVTNSIFTSNSTTNAGDTNDYGAGAIFVGGESNLNVINSAFASNVSAGNGGAIATRTKASSGGDTPSSSLYITGDGTDNTEFNGNSAVNGGAIWTEVKTVVANTNFTNNTATGNGGAISHTATDENRLLEIIADGANVEFTGNTANGSANDIYNTGRLDLIATGSSDTITFNGGITGSGDININKLVTGENDSYKILSGTDVTDNTISTAVGNVIFNGDVVADDLNVADGTLTNTAELTVNGTLTNTATIADGAIPSGTLNIKDGANDGQITQGTVNIAAGNTGFDNNDTMNVKTALNNAGKFNNAKDVIVANINNDANLNNTGIINSTAGSTITADNLTNTGGVMNLTNAQVAIVYQTGDILGTINVLGTDPANDVTDLSITGTQPNFAGNLNIGDETNKVTLNLQAGNVVEDAIVNIVSGSVLNVDDSSSAGTASVVLNSDDTFAGDVKLASGDVTMKDVNYTTGNTSTTAGASKPYFEQKGGSLFLENATLTLENAGVINAPSSGTPGDGGAVNIDSNSHLIAQNGNFEVETLQNAGTVHSINGGYENHLFDNHIVGDGAGDSQADYTIDLYARHSENKNYDQFGNDNAEISAAAGNKGTIHVADWNLNGDIFGNDAPIDKNIKLDNLFKGHIAAGDTINFTATDKEVLTPIGWYKLNSTGGGNYSFDLVRYNEAAYRGQITTLAQYQNQLAIDDMIFNHTMLDQGFKENDYITGNPNQYASSSDLFAPYQYSRKDGGLWVKTYGNFERLHTGGMDVGNNAYGTIIGADFGLKDLKRGWKFMPTTYIGYNGAHQYWHGNGAYQNGGQLGFLGTFYKKDFMIGALAYGGLYGNEMSTPRGNDQAFNYFAGGAVKSAYNWKFKKNWALQPNLLVAYNFFGQENWHTDFGQMGMMSGMLHGINIAPGLNLIYERETWSAYVTLQYMYNINQSVGGRAGNVDMPSISMDRGYIQYGIGINKKFTDRFSGYFQTVIRNVGRNGVGLQLGFQWKLGKGSVQNSKKSSITSKTTPQNKKVIKSL